MERTTIDQMLFASRTRIDRLGPEEVLDAQRLGALVLDTRDIDDRRKEGFIPGSIHVPLSVLPWRVDPSSPSTDARINDIHRHFVVVCNDGFSSSITAALLVDLGFTDVSDLCGGHRAWAIAGLPIEFC
ncbi:MAG: rhodanese-like domain-containing protein [Actinomycetia bacterium]|nr:rhodanese-like domain-containing protein [Actinomycetes bacterium]